MSVPEWVRTPHMREYYEREWGRLVDDDVRFFEFLCLEIFQAGLSWDTIVRKRDGMADALDGFDFRVIANYTDERIDELTNDARVIRYRLKLLAIRANAHVFISLVDEYGSFLSWLAAHAAEDLDGWVKLFRKKFSFTGPEIVREFLESSGVITAEDNAWTEAFQRKVESLTNESA